MRTSRLLLAGIIAVFATAPAGAQSPHAFRQRCAVCHQANGAGIPGDYPSIAGTIGVYVKVQQGREFLIHLLLFGMNGAIKSHGASYEGLMPSAADFNDKELSEALNYVLLKLNADTVTHDFKPYTAAEFKDARSHKMSPSAVLKERESLMQALGTGANGR